MRDKLRTSVATATSRRRQVVTPRYAARVLRPARLQGRVIGRIAAVRAGASVYPVGWIPEPPVRQAVRQKSRISCIGGETIRYKSHAIPPPLWLR